ncbi:MAG: DUF58 domain-containing protein [Myxococcota bacterium]
MSWWTAFWANAPRSLQFTREGQVIVGLAFFVGFAAINTGNNLLFLGWGLVLSGIVISGVLSEGTLRPLVLEVTSPGQARVGQVTGFGVSVRNSARRSIFGVELSVVLEGPGRTEQAFTPYLLRMGPRDETQMLARTTPLQRGAYRILRADATTRFPFGFFVKTRPIQLDRATYWVMPEKLDVSRLQRAMVARTGEATAHAAGPGEDYFDLRDYRPGDDLRRVRWRRAARTGRLVVVETEAMKGQEVTLELYLPSRGGRREELEHAIAVTGSAAEMLLDQGLRVGLRAPGIHLAPRGGDRQRMEVLLGLARLDLDAQSPMPQRLATNARIAIVAPGALPPPEVDLTFDPSLVARGKAA